MILAIVAISRWNRGWSCRRRRQRSRLKNSTISIGLRIIGIRTGIRFDEWSGWFFGCGSKRGDICRFAFTRFLCGFWKLPNR